MADSLNLSKIQQEFLHGKRIRESATCGVGE